MPELPEIETIRRGLERRALGRRIIAVEVTNASVIRGNAADFARAVTGGRIERVRRKGKTLAIELRHANAPLTNSLVVRLGMTGQLILADSNIPVADHTHARFALDRGSLRFRDPRRFGRLWCATVSELDRLLGSLGPDALEISDDQFVQALTGRRGPIKPLLLNQAVLSGVGNIYADEALFEARIHPETLAGSLSHARRKRLRECLREVLARAVALQGTSFRDYVDLEGKPGNFEPQLLVYGRAGQPCRRCGATIRRGTLSGRSCHYCPRCQRKPRKRGQNVT